MNNEIFENESIAFDFTLNTNDNYNNFEEEQSKSDLVQTLENIQNNKIFQNQNVENESNNKTEIVVFNIETYTKTKIEKEEPPLFNLEEILKIFEKKSSLKNLLELNSEDDIITIEELLNSEIQNTTKKIFKITCKKLRKFQNDEIILKIKSNINKYIIDFINFLIEEKNKSLTSRIISPENNMLLPIKYDLISRPLTRNFNLELLDTPLFNILSNDINGNYPKNNFNIINHIMNSEDNNYQTLKSALKLTWKDYLNIFRYNNSQLNIDENLLKLIGEKFNKIDAFIKNIKNIKEEEKNDYIISVLLNLFNYERYFINKQTRKRTDEKKKNKKW